MRRIRGISPLIPGMVLGVLLARTQGADQPELEVWKPVDVMEAKLLFGFGNGMDGRVFESLRDTAAPNAIPFGMRRHGLEKLYQTGLEHLRKNRLRAAERCFLGILAADPRDWEVREGLARIYQALGLKDKRDSALAVLRRMHRSGDAWSNTICRDVFSLSGKTIVADEIPSFDFPDRRQILFSIQDSAGGKTRFLASVSRMERRIRPTARNAATEKGQSVPGFQISFVTERQRRVYFIAYQKPGYSTMKKMVADYLAGT